MKAAEADWSRKTDLLSIRAAALLYTGRYGEGITVARRSLAKCLRGDGLDMETFVSAFADDGYMPDMPVGKTFRGRDIGDYIDALTTAFPDIHREQLGIGR